MSTASSPSRSRRLLIGGLLVVMLAAIGYALWTLRDKQQTPPVDMVAVLQVNSRGVAHMDRYEFKEAVDHFEKVVNMAPEWRPGRINLGIALINLGNDPSGGTPTQVHDRAIALFQSVLQEAPDDRHANFNLGYILLQNRGQWAEARPYFKKVAEADPNDAATWCALAQTYQDEADKALECYRQAVRSDPCHFGAVYGLMTKLREQGDHEKADALLAETERFRRAEVVATPFAANYYTERGKYHQVIGRVTDLEPPPRTGPVPLFEPYDKLKVELPEGARWATAADLGTGPSADLLRRVRTRFGATTVTLDYNGDHRPDLLILAAMVDNGRVRDLLLRNEGSGRFKDVTAEARLASGRVSLGCCVADFDNDLRPDLLVTSAGRQHLFRNTGQGTFEEVSAQAGLEKLTGVCLGAALLDLEQDGDLDIVLSRYAPAPEQALALLDGKAAEGTNGLVVLWNVGEARPVSASQDPPPLTVAFRQADGPAGLLGRAIPAVATAISDLDLDRDLDLFQLADGAPAALVLNDRLQRFHRAELPESLLAPGRYNGALVLDIDHDEQSDLVVIGPEAAPVILQHLSAAAESDPSRWFRRRLTNAPPLRHAQAIDLDLDGWTDVVGLSNDRKPMLLHNQGGHLEHVPNGLGLDSAWPADLMAVAIADLDCDGYPDLLIYSESGGLLVHRNRGNGNHGLKLKVTGHRRVEADKGGGVVRCNADGIGVRVSAQAKDHWTGLEYTTLAAGLGQSYQPFFLGLGQHAEADIVRLFWPDHSQQATFNLSSEPACRTILIDQEYRKLTSCPLLFTWNGQQFVAITDFLGAGSLGEPLPTGGHRLPRPEESVKIEPDQLVPRDGQYILKIAEPMSEVTYLDRLQLVVLDHPADVRVYPDERFHVGGPPPTQGLVAFRQQVFPVTARDHRGRDVMAKLHTWDRDTVDGYARRSWIGFAEEHFVEMDFGDRLALFGPENRLFLCLAGWTDYPYPESIWAAHQAGIELLPPVLERLGTDGKWRKVADAGFPAGLPRMMLLDVTGLLGGPRCVLRLRTNMHVFWDQAFVAPALGPAAVRTVPLEVASAALTARGVLKEYSPDGREPTLFDYNRFDAFPLSKLSGRLTRFGEVSELLRSTDDRFVIFGPGDDLEVRFDTRPLPPLPGGWKRSFVLRTWGYCKDCTPFTATGATVGPLPFRTMSKYPYGADEKHPDSEYDRTWNTRRTGQGQGQ